MNNLVLIKNNEPLTTTLIVADGMKIKHRAIMELFDKYQDDLKEFGVFTVETEKPTGKKGGRPIRFGWINEGQTVFLISLMRNSDIVVDFKKKLTKEFFRQRKLIAHLLTQRHNEDWKLERQQGKIARKESTDVVKEFIQYAINNGSKSAKFYYANITKMENKALFIVQDKFENLRDILDGQQLGVISAADTAIAKALQDGMDKGLPYKEIYQLAKERLEQFAEIVGKSLVPNIKSLNQQSNEAN